MSELFVNPEDRFSRNAAHIHEFMTSEHQSGICEVQKARLDVLPLEKKTILKNLTIYGHVVIFVM